MRSGKKCQSQYHFLYSSDNSENRHIKGYQDFEKGQKIEKKVPKRFIEKKGGNKNKYLHDSSFSSYLSISFPFSPYLYFSLYCLTLFLSITPNLFLFLFLIPSLIRTLAQSFFYTLSLSFSFYQLRASPIRYFSGFFLVRI